MQVSVEYQKKRKNSKPAYRVRNAAHSESVTVVQRCHTWSVRTKGDVETEKMMKGEEEEEQLVLHGCV